jgi:hypothetical protein
MALERVDHLVYTVPDLQAGMDEIQGRLGTRPILGGRHPSFGTHNAVLSIGPATYLEVIAPDPGLDRPGKGLPFSMEVLKRSRLATWALRAEDIQEVAAVGARAGIGLGRVEAGRRNKPDGGVLSWELTDPRAMPFGGAVPFLIRWGRSPHPGSAAPFAGDLVRLEIHHPEPSSVRHAYSALGIDMDVNQADEFRLVAGIMTADGEVVIS